jgi:hypothetical protein
MFDKDSYAFQQKRLARITEEIAPGKKVEFDDSITLIKFRVSDPVSGTVLTGASGQWLPSELADKSDDWIKTFIRQLSAGKI